MLEGEYRQLRNVNMALKNAIYRAKLYDNKDLQHVQKLIRDLMDDHLYEDYKKTLSDNELVEKIRSSPKHYAFVDHMITFVDKYEKEHKIKTK